MAKLKATPKNYAEALAVLAGRTSVRLGNNTHLLAINERVYSAGHITEERITIAVKLHDTNIVKFYEDGRITLHTGGWQTVTTKDRINEFISGRVYQKNHAWFYVGHNVEGAIDWDNPIVFSEGLNVGQEDEQDTIEAEAQAAVARYPSIREAYEAVLANRAQYHEQDSMWQYWDDVSRAI